MKYPQFTDMLAYTHYFVTEIKKVITFIDEGRPGDPSVELAQRHKWEVVCQVLRRILMRGGVPQTVRLDEFLEPRKLRKRYLYSKQVFYA